MSPRGFGRLTMAGDFEAALDSGVAMEQRLDWETALRRYDSLAQELAADSSHDAGWEARRASVEMRRGNVLLALRRMDEARAAFDANLHAAKASGDAPLLARALMAAGAFAGRTRGRGRAEPIPPTTLARLSR